MNTTQRIRNRELRFIPSNSELVERFTSVADAQFEGDKTACLESGLNALNQLKELNAEIERLNQKISDLLSEQELTDEEEAMVEKACEVSNTTRSRMKRVGLMGEVKRTLTQFEKQDFSQMSDEELKGKTVRGAASMRIKNAIAAIAYHNESCEEKADKIYISESTVFSATGSNRQAIKSYFENNKVTIDALNQKHQLDPSVNRRGKNTGFDLKATLGL